MRNSLDGVNILMLSDVYFPRVNGVSSSIRTYARELERLGHAVTIVAPDYGCGGAPDEFEILRLPSRVIFFDPEDRLMTRSGIRAAERTLAARHWDVIHIHTPFQAHRLGIRLGRVLGCPTVESYHTFFEEYVAHYLPWLPSKLLRWGARRLSRYLCHGVDHLIVPSTQMAQVLRRYGVTTPVTVIPTGIDLDEFAGGDGARFRAANGIGADQPVIVTVSRLSQEKNIGFLLEVTRTLVDAFPQLLFIIAGEGPDADRLKRMSATLGIERNVRFFGNLDRRSRLLDCYRAGDVFVFASPTETQGLVLLEAMALGVPIVSTAVMGTATVLADVRCARISTGEIAEFAGQVAALLRSPEERRERAAAAPQDARSWSAPVLMQRAIDLYAGLAARGERPPDPQKRYASAR